MKMLKKMNHQSTKLAVVAMTAVPALALADEPANQIKGAFDSAVTLLGGLTSGLLAIGGIVVTVAGVIAGFGVIKRMIARV